MISTWSHPSQATSKSFWKLTGFRKASEAVGLPWNLKLQEMQMFATNALQRSSCGMQAGFQKCSAQCASQQARLKNVKQKGTGTVYGDSLHPGKEF